MAELPSFYVTVRNEHPKLFTDGEIIERARIMAKRAIDSKAGGHGQTWEIDEVVVSDKKLADRPGSLNKYEAMLMFSRKESSPEAGEEMRKMLNFIRKKGSDTTFKPYPWEIINQDTVTGKDQLVYEEVDPKLASSECIIGFNEAATWEDIDIPDVLINGTDEEIEKHPAFTGLYGRGVHVRMIFSAIKMAISTEGYMRHHGLLWGLPGAAKTSTFAAVQEVLPENAYLKLNTNSMTRAGFEDLFLNKLKNVGYPPIIFFEEIEKTKDEILESLLSALDSRAEIRKLNARTANRAEARFLAFATANDKELFDKVAGGRNSDHPGALSSRFANQLYVPRPNRDQMRKILDRDVAAIKGDPRWVEKCLELADLLEENDPRRVQSWLAGGERLISHKYQDDVLMLYAAEQADKAKRKDA